MGAAMTANVAVVVVNTLLLTGLMVLFARMVREVRSRFTLGLLAFAAILWLQNVVQLYFYATMMQYYVGQVETLVLVQNLLATVAVAFLTYVTFSPTGRAKSKGVPSRAE